MCCDDESCNEDGNESKGNENIIITGELKKCIHDELICCHPKNTSNSIMLSVNNVFIHHSGYPSKYDCVLIVNGKKISTFRFIHHNI